MVWQDDASTGQAAPARGPKVEQAALPIWGRKRNTRAPTGGAARSAGQGGGKQGRSGAGASAQVDRATRAGTGRRVCVLVGCGLHAFGGPNGEAGWQTGRPAGWASVRRQAGWSAGPREFGSWAELGRLLLGFVRGLAG